MRMNIAAAIFVVAILEGVMAGYVISGRDVTYLTGETAVIKCKITKTIGTVDGKLHYIWETDGATIYADDTPYLEDKRMNVTMDENEMNLKIKALDLSDEKSYKCKVQRKVAVSDVIKLTVNQYPQEFNVSDTGDIPVDGEEASVARCFTKGAKPEPKMWFTDADGQEVSLDEVPVISQGDNGLFNKTITLKKTFTKEDNGKSYKCHVERADLSTDVRNTQPIKVHYTSSVFVRNYVPEVWEEGDSLQAECVARGNPTPDVTWSFTPDAKTNVTLPVGDLLPSNFQTNGARIFSNRLAVTAQGLTNNGTLTCTANNSIGSPASLSFKIGVYAAPVTTVPTTTGMAPVQEARAGGPDGAVIGGVVAVAVFVLIVAVLLIARYFMSHKGTYRTKEMTMAEDEEKRGDLMAEEDEEILAESGGRKKEFFL